MSRNSCISAVMFVSLLGSKVVFAIQDTIGPNGINSDGLTDGSAQHNPLTGAGEVIGQVEQFHPGKPSFDNSSGCCNQDVKPTGVFYRDLPMNASLNMGVGDNHAIAVAGVMISTANTAPAPHSPPTGVATGVPRLTASGIHCVVVNCG